MLDSLVHQISATDSGIIRPWDHAQRAAPEKDAAASASAGTDLSAAAVNAQVKARDTWSAPWQTPWLLPWTL